MLSDLLSVYCNLLQYVDWIWVQFVGYFRGEDRRRNNFSLINFFSFTYTICYHLVCCQLFMLSWFIHLTGNVDIVICRGFITDIYYICLWKWKKSLIDYWYIVARWGSIWGSSYRRLGLCIQLFARCALNVIVQLNK